MPEAAPVTIAVLPEMSPSELVDGPQFGKRRPTAVRGYEYGRRRPILLPGAAKPRGGSCAKRPIDLAAFAALLGDERAAIVFADPPYNVPIDGHASGLGAIHHRPFPMA